MPRKTEFPIVYEDKECLVVVKREKLLTIKTNDPKTFARNLYHQVYEYLLQKRERPFIVHRLDFETSGLLIFAKNHSLKERLQKALEERRVLRLYEGVIRESLPLHQQFQTEMTLIENKNSFRVFKNKNGKQAITLFESRAHLNLGTAMKIQILTGRKNQIRLSCLENGWTLVGDERYAKDKAKRMYLNCYALSFPEDCGLRESSFFLPPLWLGPDDGKPIVLSSPKKGPSRLRGKEG